MSSPAAWHTDPTGKHDHRWWDGTNWTEHVADAGESKIDHLSGDVPPAPAGDPSATDTTAMDTSAGPATGDTAADAGQHTDPGTGGLSGAWEGTADPQPSQPGWQQPGGAGHDATAQQPSWQQGQQGQQYNQGADPYAQQPAWDNNNPAYAQNTGGSDGVAIAALVIGILSLLTAVFVIGGLGGVIALVLGLVALGRIKRNRSGGRGMAITGIVTGALAIIVAILVVVFSVSLFGGMFSDFEQCMQENNDEAFCTRQLEDGILNQLGN
ncbi:MAG: DUF4190 domain-containing protein [Egicoccus sp.]